MDVAVERRGQRVLEHVNLSLSPGDLVALLGPNGCGKTTLLEAIAGMIPIAEGQIWFAGKRLDPLPAHARVRSGLHLVHDRLMVFPNLTVEENLALSPVSAGRRSWETALRTDDPIRLRPKQNAGSLSGGEKRIVATLGALEARPRLLLLDEFTEGLQQGVMRELLNRVRSLCREGSIAVLVVHSERFAHEEGMQAYAIQAHRLDLCRPNLADA